MMKVSQAVHYHLKYHEANSQPNTDLSTTQRYLGNVSDIEAIRWIENLYG